MSDILNNEISWFTKVLEVRLKLYFDHDCEYKDIRELPPPDPIHGKDPYNQFIHERQLTFEERLLLILVLIPHVQPQLLDPFFVKNSTYDREFTEFGAVKVKGHAGFLPSGETALFLLAGR